MKQINLSKLDSIKNKHFEYCRKLYPLNNHPIKDDNMIWQLCCENPFDFNNTRIPLKKEYIKFIYSDIKYVSQYERFRSKTEGWSGIELLRTLDVDVCPYCGINYISTIQKKDDRVVSVATFDHYLPKSGKENKISFPFLALNLYNLIPCCKNCNSTFKGNRRKPVLNPYFYPIENIVNFSVSETDIIQYLTGDNKTLEIQLNNSTSNDFFNNHTDVLSLEARYNYFQSIAKSLIYKRQKFGEEYLKELENMEIGLSVPYLESLIIRQDIFRENEPLFKFKQDIWEQISKK